MTSSTALERKLGRMEKYDLRDTINMVRRREKVGMNGLTAATMKANFQTLSFQALGFITSLTRKKHTKAILLTISSTAKANLL